MSKQRAKQRKFIEYQRNVCANKITFFTTTQARKRRRVLEKFFNVKFKIYKCDYCGYYHLSTIKEGINDVV